MHTTCVRIIFKNIYNFFNNVKNYTGNNACIVIQDGKKVMTKYRSLCAADDEISLKVLPLLLQYCHSVSQKCRRSPKDPPSYHQECPEYVLPSCWERPYSQQPVERDLLYDFLIS